VLWFGTYSLGGGYPRNTVLMDALEKRGVEVEECHAPLFADARAKVAAARGGAGSLRLMARMAVAWFRLAIGFFRAGERDAVVVGYTGHFDLYLARFLSVFRRRPLILDAFLSPWDTVVRDRALISERSLRARLLFLAERTALRLADRVLTDTGAHADYMAETFRVPREKFVPIPVGSLIGTRVPVPVTMGAGVDTGGARLRVFFCGSFVPLQGVPVILDAAALCPDVAFRIAGDGPGAEAIEAEVAQRDMPNVHLERRFITRDELTAELAAADVVLGVFGASAKTGRVVPCKVYDALAAGRCVVTGDGPAPRELLRDGEEALLVERDRPEALAAAISRLAGDAELRARLADGARNAFEERFDRAAIGGVLRGAIEQAGVR
jgi:glycosyltransferase involved in cell wall biosynthesis